MGRDLGKEKGFQMPEEVIKYFSCKIWITQRRVISW
jgi:hypothetical protein